MQKAMIDVQQRLFINHVANLDEILKATLR